MRGTLLKGKEAERIGLVNHCVAKAEVLDTAAPDRAGTGRRPELGDPLDQASVNQIVKDA
jgi:enoyl-CoA hydratase/carnithine racemase